MTELERARAQLLRCHGHLAHFRRWLGLHPTNWSREKVAEAQDNYLAALSWVWDAQKRHNQTKWYCNYGHR